MLWASIDNDDSRDLDQLSVAEPLAGGAVKVLVAALAQHCTAQENSAAKVERQVRKSAAALLLAPRIGARFEAIVTGASEKGTWVRVARPAVEGRVVRGFEGLDVGDRGLFQYADDPRTALELLQAKLDAGPVEAVPVFAPSRTPRHG